MSDTPTRVLAFVNRVRAVQGQHPLRYLAALGADALDERNCILAQSLGCAVGLSEEPRWRVEGRWVMRFDDRLTARAVAVATGEPWLPERGEVALPDDVVDLAVSFYLGLVEQDESGFVRSWLVPHEGGQERLISFARPAAEPPEPVPSPAAA